MPRLFGSFKDNWTLDSVCDDCNGYFGRELEIHLGRDTHEAVHRLQHGLKRAVECDELSYNRITMVVEEPGPFQGARVEIGPDAANGVQPIPVPQVGFRRPGEPRFKWFLESELEQSAMEPYQGRGWEIRVIGPEVEDRHRLIDTIRQIGIPFDPQPETQELIVNERNQVMVATDATLDVPIQRGIAKIALNFAAYLLGPDFLMTADFDPVRGFIRFGAAPGFQTVRPTDEPILQWDTKALRQTTAHVIVLEWGDRDTLIVRFSPFNFITYRIVLCPMFHGIWRDIAFGYVFDHKEHTIIRLHSLPLRR